MLLYRRNPPTVTRLVPQIVVNPVQGSTGGPPPHINQAVGKTLWPLPTRADGDTSATIVRIVRVRWLPATVQHRSPTLVRRGSNGVSAPRLPVPTMDFGSSLLGKAAARRR